MSLRLLQDRVFEAKTLIDIGAAEGAFFLVRASEQLFPSARHFFVDAMQGAGWALYDLTDLGHNPSDATLYQCYATFIPRSMDFRRGTPWCLPDQEQIALQQLRARRASVRKSIEDLVRRG